MTILARTNTSVRSSRTVTSAYHFCMENRLTKRLFSDLVPKNSQVVNLKNPDLDWSGESIRSVDFMDSWSVFGFHQKTQNPLLDSGTRFVFSQKNAPWDFRHIPTLALKCLFAVTREGLKSWSHLGYACNYENLKHLSLNDDIKLTQERTGIVPCQCVTQEHVNKDKERDEPLFCRIHVLTLHSWLPLSLKKENLKRNSREGQKW